MSDKKPTETKLPMSSKPARRMAPKVAPTVNASPASGQPPKRKPAGGAARPKAGRPVKTKTAPRPEQSRRAGRTDKPAAKRAPRAKDLATLLVQQGVMSQEKMDLALKEKPPSGRLGEYLVSRGDLSENDLLKAYESYLGIPLVNVHQYTVRRSTLNLLSQEYVQTHLILPLKSESGVLTLAMNNPMDYFTIDKVELTTGLTVSPVVAAKDDIMLGINKNYASQDDTRPARQAPTAADTRIDGSAVKMFNQILMAAVQLRASDVHVDPMGDYVQVRYRVDGELRQGKQYPKSQHSTLVARVKIISGLDITQNRTPQDGRFSERVGGTPVDVRVSILPTVNGEKIVIRILDLSDANRRLSDMGFSQDNADAFSALLKRPSGLILLTGPTGSGKSSTLYASIQELNKGTVNIMTVEDPVELQLEGINQIQVNSEVGLTFPAALRSILRQDPNIIMLGEIRDSETAEIAVRSALTGHLVLSTLHTNSAIDAVPRLVDMGIEPYLVSSSVKGVVAQRLLRRLCNACKKERPASEFEKALYLDRGSSIETMYDPVGCEQCQHAGYKGRVGVHELVTITDEMKRKLLQDGSTSDLLSIAERDGMKFLLDDGMLKAKEGITTMDEVLRIATDD